MGKINAKNAPFEVIVTTVMLMVILIFALFRLSFAL